MCIRDSNISLALGLLLGDLLLLDGAAELLAKHQMRDRDIIQDDVEVVGALRERRADLGPAFVILLGVMWRRGVMCVSGAARSKDGD